MNSGEYYNQPAADWARQNIRGRVAVRPLLSSRAGMILTYSLLFCVPGAFFALALAAFVLGVRDPYIVQAPFFFGLLLLMPSDYGRCTRWLGCMALLKVGQRYPLLKASQAPNELNTNSSVRPSRPRTLSKLFTPVHCR